MVFRISFELERFAGEDVRAEYSVLIKCLMYMYIRLLAQTRFMM